MHTGPVPPHLQHCDTPTIPGKSFIDRPEYPIEEEHSNLVAGTAPKRPLTYLACPYSHPDKVKRAVRYVESTEATAWLIRVMKWNVFSPITHSHPLAEIGGLTSDWSQWRDFDYQYLEVSQRLVVLEIPGWRESVGVTAEIEKARKLGIEIIYMWPNPGRRGVYDLAPHPMDEKAAAPATTEVPFIPSHLPSGPDFIREERKIDLAKFIEADLKPTNAKDKAATNRLDISLFPAAAIIYGALGMVEGDCKYGGYNYRVSGVLASIYVAALFRHTLRWFSGQDVDQKTKVPHLASMISCVAILIDAVECGKLKDDRPPRVDTSGLLSRFEGIVKHLNQIFPNGPDRYTQATQAHPACPPL